MRKYVVYLVAGGIAIVEADKYMIKDGAVAFFKNNKIVAFFYLPHLAGFNSQEVK